MTDLKDITSSIYTIKDLGAFKLRKVHPTWSNPTMLGVFDYFNTSNVNAYQILPDKNHSTLDIPDMSKELIVDQEPIWKWLNKEWKYDISDKISVVTNLETLKGKTVTEVMRWEKEEWEMFAGSGEDVKEEDIRVVPLGLLLGIDKSLEHSLNLNIGKGMWRKDALDEWKDWG